LKLRHAIKDYQRRLVQLDADHQRAQGHLTTALRRRAEVIAEQDALVTLAEEEALAAIAAMAGEVGPDQTASLLEIDASRVRRIMKQMRSCSTMTIAGDQMAESPTNTGAARPGRVQL
jgi:hypothetical protein